MKLYKLTDMSCETVDLDDEATYSELPNTYEELTYRMHRNIGYALSYMDFINPDLFPIDDKQRRRVIELIAKFWKDGRKEIDVNSVAEKQSHQQRFNLRWLKEQVFIFEDEIENMC